RAGGARHSLCAGLCDQLGRADLCCTATSRRDVAGNHGAPLADRRTPDRDLCSCSGRQALAGTGGRCTGRTFALRLIQAFSTGPAATSRTRKRTHKVLWRLACTTPLLRTPVILTQTVSLVRSFRLVPKTPNCWSGFTGRWY